MNRKHLAAALGIVVLSLFFLSATSTEGGCHGGCVSPGGGSPNACDGTYFFPAAFPLLDTVVTGGTSTTNLEFYSIPLPAGQDSSSRIFAGEATAFYVASGAITFDIEASVAAGSVRVVETPNGNPAEASGIVVIEAGGALFVDAQEQAVNVGYLNEGDAEATVLIASAIPCLPATPASD